MHREVRDLAPWRGALARGAHRAVIGSCDLHKSALLPCGPLSVVFLDDDFTACHVPSSVRDDVTCVMLRDGFIFPAADFHGILTSTSCLRCFGL